MEHDGANLAVTEAVRSVQLLKIDGYCATATMMTSEFIKSRWDIDGHEWEVRFYPDYWYFVEDEDDCFPGYHVHDDDDHSEWVGLKLILVSEPQRDKLRVNLSCRLVCPSQRHLDASEEKRVSHVFASDSRCSPEVLLFPKYELPSSGYLVNDSLTVECTVTVLRDLGISDGNNEEQPLPAVPVPPPSDLHQHLGELLQSKDGADVTFHVSGESFAAHRVILAARSPVFKAEFFGGMEERSSVSVEIKDMEAAVFRSMLHFIYTDMAPELDGAQEPEAAAAMAQHLLVAADRYGLNRLKLMCECKLFGGIGIGTAAATLALAEQHNCSLLKAKCLEFVTSSPETLDAVLASDGYAHLVASCPLVLTELLRAACGKKV